MAADLAHHPYATFMSGVQALRRLTEAETWGFGGALGAAADPYPHQLATVRRVLTDPYIRHLLADEVGLGKTVQVAMIINALRWRDPGHRTIIVAPDRLLSQWQSELWCRGHVKAAPAREPGDDFERPDVLLLGPHDLATGSTQLDAAFYDLLVVDEPQALPREVVQRLSAACVSEEGGADGRFREVLILSATPKLGDQRWRDLLLPMIEPERTSLARLAGEEVDARMVRDEVEAATTLNAGAASTNEAERLRMFRNNAVTRRVVRNTRADWRDLLPQRDIRDCVFAPTDSELVRLELADRLIARAAEADDLSQQPWTTVKSLLRARRSARAAIDALGPSGQLAARARRLALEDPGDSRLEALVDVLAEQWELDPDARFVIVAGDAGSIDMLVSKLPRYFPEITAADIATLKRPTSGAEDSVEHFREMHEAVQPFVAGASRLLLLGDWVQAGLNLHHTSNSIIFYSVPWDVQAVDQLIGRIDRLRRNSFANAVRGRSPGRVRIWRLIMEGSPEQRVLGAHDALGVFQRPLPQVPEDDWKLIDRSITSCARGDQGAALATLASLAESWTPIGMQSQLDPAGSHLWNEAMRCQDRLNETPVVQPSMLRKSGNWSVVETAENANEAWLHLLSRSRQWEVGYRRDRSDPDYGFTTFWYAGKPAGVPFLIRDIDVSSRNAGFAPMLTQRRKLKSPPRASVVVDEGEPDGRLLRFFDHGEVIHDDLVEQYREKCEQLFGEAAPVRDVIVRLTGDHPLARWAGRQAVLSIGMHSTTSQPGLKDAIAELQMMADLAPTSGARERLRADLAGFRAETAADRRWLADILQARLVLKASVAGSEGWEPVADETAIEFFSPLHWTDGGFEALMPQPGPGGNGPARGRDCAMVARDHSTAIRRRVQEDMARIRDGAIQAYRSRSEELTTEQDRRSSLRRARIDRRSEQLARATGTQLQLIEGQVSAEERRLEFNERASRLRRELMQNHVARELAGPTVTIWRLSVRFSVFG